MKGKVEIQCILNKRTRFPQQHGTCFIKIGYNLRKLCWFEDSAMFKEATILDTH